MTPHTDEPRERTTGPLFGRVRHSLRFRLALSYAGIALLTVAILGTIVVSVLSQYYRRAEDRYLEAVAARASSDLMRFAESSDLDRVVAMLALTSQTRVRILGPRGALLADSGLPTEIDPALWSRPDFRLGERARPRDLPSPLGSGPFGSQEASGSPRSERVLSVRLTRPVGNAQGSAQGTLLLSDGPASGRDVLAGVTHVMGLAAAIATLLAAAAGYFLSARLAQPIIALTETSDRMAGGELSARSNVARGDEVGRLAESFDAMADRIEATVVTLRRFVADAAHEIGTPLTALQADLELAEVAESDAEQRALVRRALGQARRIEDLSGNLLRLSRLEAGESEATAGIVDIPSLVRAAAEEAASRAEQAGISLSVETEGALNVRGSAQRLRTVLDNLIDNALKFTAEGGSVEVGARPDHHHALVWVSDTGIGIPEAERADVFSRFYRARNVSAYPGSGLGLAIVLATVEGYGGTVGVRSDESGTRFEVRLPLA